MQIEIRHREAAWPIRPECYAAHDKDRWMAGVYDSVAEIQAFATFESQLTAESRVEIPCEATPAMMAAAWDVIDKAKRNQGVRRLMPGIGAADIWRVMVRDHLARAAGGEG